MKTIIKTGLFFSFIVLAVACSDASDKSATTPKDEHAGHDHTKTEAVTEPVQAKVQVKDDMLNAIYQQYVNLTAALVESDAAKAKVAANAIEAGAKELKGSETIQKAAAAITAAKDIEAQRTAYSDLSNNLIEMVKKAGMNSGAVYVDFCPMALNDKGAYWLSNDKGIKNPYFGSSMLTCGEVKETLQ